MALVGGERPATVTIPLPIGSEATFTPVSWAISPGRCACGVVKDAGDDPDVTHGAEIRAAVRWLDRPGMHLRGGEGVGTVTLPGLGLEVGGPAINPVPRRMIEGCVADVAGALLERRGIEVEISVLGGAELAKRTMNARLGIVGGLSILGTTGIVKPYSTASWRASVEQGIDVAAANGEPHLVLSTGGRSERHAIRLLRLPELAYVEVGIFMGAALRRCVARGVARVTIAGMVGKFAKMAQGHLQTHVAGNVVDPGFLSQLARAHGASDELTRAIAGANTARHVQELVQASGSAAFFPALAGAVAEQARRHVRGTLDVEAVLFDFDGRMLGRGEAR